jgi:hypothetical protein
MESWLFKLGIPTYTYTFYTQLDGSITQNINQNMPQPVGRIYGISTITDSCLPKDSSQSLLSVFSPISGINNNVADISISFKYAATEFYDTYRLDQLLHVYPAYKDSESGAIIAPQYNNSTRYRLVNIPGDIDLKYSFYTNPKNVGGFNVALTIHYIDVNTYADMLNDGLVLRNAKNVKGQVKVG